MNRLWHKFLAWREERFLKSWESARTRGKKRYVVRVSILWGGGLAILYPLFQYTVDHSVGSLVFNAIYFALAAPIIGLVSWWLGEIWYSKSKLRARISASGQAPG